MKALISPNENNRIVEVSSSSFPVAAPLFWVDCPDNIQADWKFNQNGTFTEPPVLVQEIPSIVSRAQARKALVLQGLFNLVQPAIDSIPDPVQRQLVQIDWEDSQVFERNNSTLAMLATGLGLSDQQLDGLFTLAASL